VGCQYCDMCVFIQVPVPRLVSVSALMVCVSCVLFVFCVFCVKITVLSKSVVSQFVAAGLCFYARVSSVIFAVSVSCYGCCVGGIIFFAPCFGVFVFLVCYYWYF